MVLMNDIQEIFNSIINSGDSSMKELIAFFKEIFMMKDENSSTKIGLSQFKAEKEEVKPVKKVKKIEREVKLSDLMRRSA